MALLFDLNMFYPLHAHVDPRLAVAEKDIYIYIYIYMVSLPSNKKSIY